MDFYATHGIEIEHFIVDKNGKIVENPRLGEIWNTMFENAYNYILCELKKAPSFVREKIYELWVDEVEISRTPTKYISCIYAVGSGKTKINLFGPDPNISHSTMLLEIVTPPSTKLEEMEYWVNLLSTAAQVGLPQGYSIISVGFHPLEEEYKGGLTCGEHHHMSFSTKAERIMMYNLSRVFVPHFIGLTADSPVRGGRVLGTVEATKLRDGRTLLQEHGTISSIRLYYNTGQLGPENENYLPYSTLSMSDGDFAAYVNRIDLDARYVDIYPFTKYGTLEIRFMDAQIEPAIRRGIIVLLQAMAMKAKRMVEEDIELPKIESSIIFQNREIAIRNALHGNYIPAKVSAKWFEEFYCRDFRGETLKYLLHATRRMVDFLKPELEQLHVQNELDAILMMLYGNKEWAPPLEQATYLAYTLKSQSLERYMDMIKSKTIGIFHSAPKSLRELFRDVVIEYSRGEKKETRREVSYLLEKITPEIKFAEVRLPEFTSSGPHIERSTKEWVDDKYEVSLWLPPKVFRSIGILSISGNLLKSKVTVGVSLPPKQLYLTESVNSQSVALPVPIPTPDEYGTRRIYVGVFVNDNIIAKFTREINFIQRGSVPYILSVIEEKPGITKVHISGEEGLNVFALGPVKLELGGISKNMLQESTIKKAPDEGTGISKDKLKTELSFDVPYSFYPKYYLAVLNEDCSGAYCGLVIPPKPDFNAFVSADVHGDRFVCGKKYKIFLNVESSKELFIHEILLRTICKDTDGNQTEKIHHINVGRKLNNGKIPLIEWKAPDLDGGRAIFSARIFDMYGPIWLETKSLELGIVK
ncbi:MAG: hypothetical protein QXL15_02865 [Candidatus Korarchaeota archaeon]